jgi:hypothetical protein
MRAPCAFSAFAALRTTVALVWCCALLAQPLTARAVPSELLPCALLHNATAASLLGVPARRPASAIRYLPTARPGGWASCVARVTGGGAELALSIATTASLQNAEDDATSARYDFFCRSIPQAMRIAIEVDPPPRIPGLGQWAFNSMLGVYVLAGDVELLTFAGAGGLSKLPGSNFGGVAFNDLSATKALAHAILALPQFPHYPAVTATKPDCDA